MLADCHLPWRREWGAIAAVGWRRPPWSGCIFLPSFHLANCMSGVCRPWNQQNPTTVQPNISINIWRNGTFEVPILCAYMVGRSLCCMGTQTCLLGVGGARWTNGRHGWIVFCVHLSYFKLEYISSLIIILIPLWRGFYFSKNILSNVHTKDVSYHRTESRCGTVVGFWLVLGLGDIWHAICPGQIIVALKYWIAVVWHGKNPCT